MKYVELGKRAAACNRLTRKAGMVDLYFGLVRWADGDYVQHATETASHCRPTWCPDLDDPGTFGHVIAAVEKCYGADVLIVRGRGDGIWYLARPNPDEVGRLQDAIPTRPIRGQSKQEVAVKALEAADNQLYREGYEYVVCDACNSHILLEGAEQPDWEEVPGDDYSIQFTCDNQHCEADCEAFIYRPKEV